MRERLQEILRKTNGQDGYVVIADVLGANVFAGRRGSVWTVAIVSDELCGVNRTRYILGIDDIPGIRRGLCKFMDEGCSSDMVVFQFNDGAQSAAA